MVIMQRIHRVHMVVIAACDDYRTLRQFKVPHLPSQAAMFDGSVLLGTLSEGARYTDVILQDVAVTCGWRLVNNCRVPLKARLPIVRQFANELHTMLKGMHVSVQTLPTVPLGPTAYSMVTSTAVEGLGLRLLDAEAVLDGGSDNGLMPVTVWFKWCMVTLSFFDNQWYCVQDGCAYSVTRDLKMEVSGVPPETEITNGMRSMFQIKVRAPSSTLKSPMKLQDSNTTPMSAGPVARLEFRHTMLGRAEVVPRDVLLKIRDICKNSVPWDVMKLQITTTPKAPPCEEKRRAQHQHVSAEEDVACPISAQHNAAQCPVSSPACFNDVDMD
jgi:hypothetical protein